MNFFQYLNCDYENLRGNIEDIVIDKNQREYLNWLETNINTIIRRLGTGADLKDYIDMKNEYSQKLVRKKF